MKKTALYLSLTLLSIFPAYSQSGKTKSPQGDYLPILRKMADSLLSAKVNNEAAAYYTFISSEIYHRAQQITNLEAARQQGTANNDFIQTLRQLLFKLRADLNKEKHSLKGMEMPTHFLTTTKAALQNFNRYEPPAGIAHEDYYLWTMIQVFENLDQINVGFLQAELNSGQRNAVLKRLTIQQKVIAQLKLKISH